MIFQAATQIHDGKKSYKAVCLQMGINLDSNGKYLDCTGKEYLRVSRAVRALRERKRKLTAKQQEEQTRELLRKIPRISRERDNAVQKVTALTKRAVAAEQQTAEAQKREQQTVKQKYALIKTLDRMDKVLRELRAGREQYREMSNKYPILLNERDNAVQKVTALTKRAVAAEQQAAEAQKREDQAVKQKHALTKTLDNTNKLLRELRAGRNDN